jgi:hypothetical protein
MTEAIYFEVTEKVQEAKDMKRRVSVSGMLVHLGVSLMVPKKLWRNFARKGKNNRAYCRKIYEKTGDQNLVGKALYRHY